VSAPNFEKPADSNHDGLYEVNVGVSDGDFGRDTQTIKVKVTDINEAPTITSGGAGEFASYVVIESALHHDRNVITTIQAIDPDKSDALTYSIVHGTGLDKKGHPLFSIDKATGELSFLGEPDDGKSYNVTVQVSDKHGLVDSQAITVRVDDQFLTGTASVDNFVFKPDFDKAIVQFVRSRIEFRPRRPGDRPPAHRRLQRGRLPGQRPCCRFQGTDMMSSSISMFPP